MTNAEQIMYRYNSNALVGPDEDGAIAMIEDVTDPDGRMYRLEYRSTPDGRHAVAFCRYNPWGETPNSGESYQEGHVADNGFLCLGDDHPDQVLEHSPYDLDYVIKRARFWCTAFSWFKEHRTWPKT